jgi:hypothetical protein
MSIGTEENEALQECIITFKVTVFRKANEDRILFLEAEQDCVDTALQPAPPVSRWTIPDKHSEDFMFIDL